MQPLSNGIVYYNDLHVGLLIMANYVKALEPKRILQQVSHEYGILEVLGIVMGCFICQGIPEKPGNVMEFFH